MIVILFGLCAGFFKTGIWGDVDLAADDRLYPRLFTFKIKGDSTEHNAVIRYCYRALTAFCSPCGNLAYTARAVKQTVFAMQMQMNKISHYLTSLLFFSQIPLAFVFCD